MAVDVVADLDVNVNVDLDDTTLTSEHLGQHGDVNDGAVPVSLATRTMRASAVGEGNAAACIPAEKCCKICGAGRACGNSCISAKKQCHKGRGCACNAAEICSP